jgi:hypothetical protein
MSTTGFIYLTDDQIDCYFRKQSENFIIFAHSNLKYFHNSTWISQNWSEDELIIPYDPKTISSQNRLSYISKNQGIERFCQIYPKIRYDTDNEMRKMEYDYDNEVDFMKDQDERIKNMCRIEPLFK